MNKRIALAALIMTGGNFVLGYFLPWWGLVIWVILIAYFFQLSGKSGFLIGGICFALVWLAMASYMSVQDDADIIGKTGTLLGGVSSSVLMVIIGVAGFITGSLAGWFGSAVGIFVRRRVKSY